MMRELDLSTEGPLYMSFISRAQCISRYTLSCAPPSSPLLRLLRSPLTLVTLASIPCSHLLWSQRDSTYAIYLANGCRDIEVYIIYMMYLTSIDPNGPGCILCIYLCRFHASMKVMSMHDIVLIYTCTLMPASKYV